MIKILSITILFLLYVNNTAVCQSIKYESCYTKGINSQTITHYNWPCQTHRKYLSGVPVEYGDIHFVNEDKMEGLISFFKVYSKFIHIIILPEGKKSESNMIELYGKEIKYFRIYNVSISKTGFIDFLDLYNKYKLRNYWRLLCTKNAISIFDDYKFKLNYSTYSLEHNWITTTSISKNKLILCSENNYTKIYWGGGMFRNVKNSLRRFINKRYNQHCKKEMFKSETDMLIYILNKENERLNNNSNNQ